MRFWERGQAFFLGMAALFLLFSILCRFMTGVILKRLLREAENMSATKDRTLRQCKLKFQSCYNRFIDIKQQNYCIYGRKRNAL